MKKSAIDDWEEKKREQIKANWKTIVKEAQDRVPPDEAKNLWLVRWGYQWVNPVQLNPLNPWRSIYSSLVAAEKLEDHLLYDPPDAKDGLFSYVVRLREEK